MAERRLVMGAFESMGGTGEADEEALNAVARLIQDRQPGSMVQSFVLMVVVIDEEDRWISSFVAPGQKAWESMGLLQWGLAAENMGVLTDGDDDE